MGYVVVVFLLLLLLICLFVFFFFFCFVLFLELASLQRNAKKCIMRVWMCLLGSVFDTDFL